MRKIWKKFGTTEKISVILLAVIVVVSILAPILAPYDPNKTDMSVKLSGFCAVHPLGTDHLGRDLLSRLMYGGRTSILLAVIATMLSMLVGLILGVASGYAGGWVDQIFLIFTSMFQGLPGTCVMIALVGIFGASVQSLIAALVFISWADFSRVVRLEMMQVKGKTYAVCAKNYGMGHIGLILRHLLPNMADNLIVLFTNRVSQAILSVASLSFLGLGVQPPTPDWGVMVNDARSYFYNNLHLLILPCLCIFAVSWSISTIGEGLRHYIGSKRDSVKEI